MPIKQISTEEAKKLLDSGEDYIYLDVRSEYEFEQGHPQGAVNIPLQQLNESIQSLEPNSDFVEVVEANFPKDAKLLIGCASGHRSDVAGEILAQRGYQSVVNIDGGFSGKRDMFGNVQKPGWMQLGYPVASGEDAERGYAAAKKKAASD